MLSVIGCSTPNFSVISWLEHVAFDEMKMMFTLY